ncbi:MAG: Lrp/AsnC family transcriptional regulator, partial [Mesorhizobium sp.]
GVRRTITSMAMREIKGDISFANAVGHTQQKR